MNAGTIAARYATALVKYVGDCGGGEELYTQACAIMKWMEEVPQLRDVLIKRKDISHNKRMSLLQTALGEKPEESLDNFISLLERRGRMEFFDRMLWAFIKRYRKANNIRVGHLVTAFELAGLKENMESLLSARTGDDVRIDVRNDPDIIGGFVFDMDGMRVDASVKTRLSRLHKELIDMNKKII